MGHLMSGILMKGTHPAMHAPPAAVHPEKVLKAKVLPQTGVQDLHCNHHVPAVFISQLFTIKPKES